MQNLVQIIKSNNSPCSIREKIVSIPWTHSEFTSSFQILVGRRVPNITVPYTE